MNEELKTDRKSGSKNYDDQNSKYMLHSTKVLFTMGLN